MSKTVLYLLAILTAAYLTKAHKILLVAPTASKSHGILAEGLIRHLTKAGHEITYIATFPPKKPLPGVNVVDNSNILKSLTYLEDILNLETFMEKKFDINQFTSYAQIIVEISQLTIENPNVQKLIADKSQHFDLVISELTFNTIFAGFSGLYNCPLIWFIPTNPSWMLFELIDEATNPAYSVGTVSSSVPPLTFKERVVELCFLVIGKMIQIFWTRGVDNELYEKNFTPLIREKRNNVPSLEALAYNASLVLSNYHISMSVSVREPQNYKSIGGFHIDQEIKPLPQDLQKLMDDAKHGVIYFSLGSNLQSKQLPSEIKRDLLTMFGKLKQTVLWKFEEELPNLPSNVRILLWAPQQSILAHKNCVLFITHGGLLSTTETIHFGVPTIGIPVFYDQFVNVERSVNMGFAKKVDLSYTIAQDLELAIQDVLEDTKYTAKVQELSKIYHDRPVPPGTELVHWVQHVIKTGGAPHLRSPALLLSWYQKLYLDLALVLLILAIVLKFTFRFVFAFYKNNIRKNRQEIVTNGKQKLN